MTPIAKCQNRFTETEIDGEIVVMHLDKGDFFSLSGSGAEIWRLIDGRRDRGKIVAALSEQFEIDTADIADEVDTFLSNLAQVGFVEG